MSNPQKTCECACHENKIGKPYAHDTQCCKNMNGYVVDRPPVEKEEGKIGHFPESCPLCPHEATPTFTDKDLVNISHQEPSKGWEERFDKEFNNSNSNLILERVYPNCKDQVLIESKVKSFITQELRRERMKWIEKIECKKIVYEQNDDDYYEQGFNDGLDLVISDLNKE